MVHISNNLLIILYRHAFVTGDFQELLAMKYHMASVEAAQITVIVTQREAFVMLTTMVKQWNTPVFVMRASLDLTAKMFRLEEVDPAQKIVEIKEDVLGDSVFVTLGSLEGTAVKLHAIIIATTRELVSGGLLEEPSNIYAFARMELRVNFAIDIGIK